MPAYHRRTSRQDKIDWLLAHEALWAGWPNGELNSDSRHHAVVRAMKAAGLIRKTTYWPEVALGGLIQDARKQRREAMYGG